MPTTEYKARKLLKKEKAVIEKYDPFTIRLTEREDGEVQDIEYKCDTGYQHIGISICSEKKEYVNEQRDLLTDEVEKHNDRLKYRRTRRNHLRYRKSRFHNRKKHPRSSDKWFAPSLDNKLDQHVKLYERYLQVAPITDAVFEMGNFDTQLLKAIEEGKPLPEGTDYQHGERYLIGTLREAVFLRDKHQCIICGRGIKEHAILHAHHVGFWKEDRTNRISNLATDCEKCHTSKNHKPGGKLYGLEPKLKTLKAASFMTTIRWAMLDLVKQAEPDVDVKITYGAMTKEKRKALHLKKTHSNDAYAMGKYHPKHRTDFRHYKKRRRNNRILEKFYDAVFIDIRDRSEKSGSQLGCNRTKRREPRISNKNERIYRGQKIKKGYRSIRKRRHSLRPKEKVLFEGKTYVSKGIQSNGTRISIETTKTVSMEDLQQQKYKNGNLLPVKVGQNLVLVGKRQKHKVLSITTDGLVVLRWYKSVPVANVTRASAMVGGWIQII